jgi:PTH1 family peptidyl-tRNA hydrolase
VVGLGNPGAEFVGTRHNVGADAVELLAQRHGVTLRAEKGQRASMALASISQQSVALAVPHTYMNDSGAAVRPLTTRFGIEDPRRLVVVHDELDLPPGRLRVKVGGGLAGHNGLRSIKSHLHTDEFVRVRIGIGKPPDPQRGADHVLTRPSRSDRARLADAVARAADAVETLVADGVEAAMLAANTDPDEARP